MPPPEFQSWLAQNGGGETLAGGGPRPCSCAMAAAAVTGGTAPAGANPSSTVRAPALAGLYGSPVPLSDGTVVIADDRYIHDASDARKARSSQAIAPLMPSFAGQIGEEDL